MLECPSVKKKKSIVLQTKNVHKKKFNCWSIPIELFLWWLAVVFRVILFQPFVKYWWNNYVGDVTVEVTYAMILFKLSRIYRRTESIGNTAVIFRVILFQPFVKYWWNYYVGDVTVEVAYAIILFKLSRIYRRTESIGNTVRN